MILTLITATVAALPALNTPRLLSCIEQVEGHKWSDPGGAYAIQPSVWTQHTRLPYRFASLQQPASDVAHRHLAWLARSLRSEGIEVNAYTLAGCWRFGFEGFIRRARVGEIEYATRVHNLYNSHHSFP